MLGHNCAQPLIRNNTNRIDKWRNVERFRFLGNEIPPIVYADESASN